MSKKNKISQYDYKYLSPLQACFFRQLRRVSANLDLKCSFRRESATLRYLEIEYKFLANLNYPKLITVLYNDGQECSIEVTSLTDFVFWLRQLRLIKSEALYEEFCMASHRDWLKNEYGKSVSNQFRLGLFQDENLNNPLL